MRAAEGFFSGFWRKLGYIAAAALVAYVASMFGAAEARAADSCTPQTSGFTGWACIYKGDAYNKAATYIDNQGRNPTAKCVAQYGAGFTGVSQAVVASTSTVFQSRVNCYNASGTLWAVGLVSFQTTHNGSCPAGSVWKETIKACWSPEQCLALNGNGFDVNELRVTSYPAGTAPPNSYCPPSGCEFVRTGNASGVCAGGECQNWSTWNYSGSFCSTVPTEPEYKPAPPDPQLTDPNAQPESDKCRTDPASTLTTCSKPDGQVCVSFKSGRRSCWQPGETGEKTDGPELQKRNAGTETVPPASMVLPSGDTLTKTAGPLTLTTTKTSPTNVSTTSSTTTVNNYITTNGTNAGTTNQGESTNADGTGTGDAQGDGEDGDKGSVSGGAVCDAAPTCSGGVIDCAVLKQAWHTRCDGNSEGIAALEAFDQAHLDDALTEAVDNGAVLGIDGQGDVGNHRVLEQFGGEGLNAGGFLGSGGCPSFPTPQVKGMPVVIDFQKICDLLATISNLVMGLAYYLSFRIIAGGGSK